MQSQPFPAGPDPAARCRSGTDTSNRSRPGSRLLSALVLGLAVSILPPAPTTAAPAQPAWPHEDSDLTPDERVLWGRLANGIGYALMPHNEPPGRVSVRLYVRAGSLMEEERELGLAHFLEHMAFNGTGNFAADEMVEYFQRLGMAFGADTNAHTGFDQTVYKLELPRNDLNLIEEGLVLLRDYADGMLLEPAEIDKERGVILSEKRARNSVRLRTLLAQLKFLFPLSRVGTRHPGGSDAVIDAAKRADLLAFYRDWYTANRLVLAVVGDFQTQPLIPLLEKHLGTIPAPEVARTEPDLGRIGPSGLRVTLHTELEAPSVTVTVQALQQIAATADTSLQRRAELRLQLAHAILNRRLEVLAKQENAPFSSGTAFAYDWLQFVRSAGLELSCRPAQWKDALHIAEQELRRARQFGFTDGEVKEVAAKTLNAAEQNVRQAATRKSRDLANGLVRHLSRAQVFTSPETELDLIRTELATLGPAELLQAFRSVWDTKDVQVLVAGSLVLDQPEPTVRQAFLSSRDVPVEAPVASTVPEFAYTDFGPAGSIVNRSRHDDLDITQLSLANNVRINLKPTPFEARIIHVALRFGSGLLAAAPNTPGLDWLTARTYIAGGLEQHSADDLKRILAGHNVGVELRPEPDAFVMTGTTTPEDLLLQLRLMAAYLLAPGYRQEALQLARKEYEELSRTLRHTAAGVFRGEVDRFVAGGDVRFGMATAAEMEELDLDDVRAWLDESRQRAPLAVSIVGDFEMEPAVAHILNTLGALPARERDKAALTERRQVSFPGPARAKSFPFESELPKAIAAVYWPTADIWDIARTRRLAILAKVFSDHLRIRLREETGKAYSPYATTRQSDTYSDYGYLNAIVLVAPDQVDPVLSTMRAIAANLYRNGVSEDELQRALRPQLNKLQEWVRNNRYWLNNVLLAACEYPVRLDWARTMADDFATITAADLTALARQYLAPEQALVVRVIPVPGAAAEDDSGAPPAP